MQINWAENIIWKLQSSKLKYWGKNENKSLDYTLSRLDILEFQTEQSKNFKPNYGVWFKSLTRNQEEKQAPKYHQNPKFALKLSRLDLP